MIQFAGINFIEHISFSAFYEGIRLKKSVRYGRDVVGKITHLLGDDIYATHANRTYCKKENITHGFKRTGRAGKHEEHRKILHYVLRGEQ